MASSWQTPTCGSTSESERLVESGGVERDGREAD